MIDGGVLTFFNYPYQNILSMHEESWFSVIYDSGQVLERWNMLIRPNNKQQQQQQQQQQ